MSASNFDPADPVQERFGRSLRDLPSPRDAAVDDYVVGLRSDGPPSVTAAIAIASDAGRDALLTYAERAASRAVRGSEPDLLVLALIAVVVGGLHMNEREALMVMPLIEDAARRVGADLVALFEEAEGVVGSSKSANLMAWLARPPESRTLAGMGFEVVDDESGFRYQYVP